MHPAHRRTRTRRRSLPLHEQIVVRSKPYRTRALARARTAHATRQARREGGDVHNRSAERGCCRDFLPVGASLKSYRQNLLNQAPNSQVCTEFPAQPTERLRLDPSCRYVALPRSERPGFLCYPPEPGWSLRVHSPFRRTPGRDAPLPCGGRSVGIGGSGISLRLVKLEF